MKNFSFLYFFYLLFFVLGLASYACAWVIHLTNDSEEVRVDCYDRHNNVIVGLDCYDNPDDSLVTQFAMIGLVLSSFGFVFGMLDTIHTF